MIDRVKTGILVSDIKDCYPHIGNIYIYIYIYIYIVRLCICVIIQCHTHHVTLYTHALLIPYIHTYTLLILYILINRL